MYPVAAVNITVHQKITFTGDLSQDGTWDVLLDQIDSMKQSEGKPDSYCIFWYDSLG